MTERLSSRASKGGKARAAKLSAEERRQIGIAGSVARWGKSLPEARYGSPDQPLRMGAVAIPCYILDDERRVLLQEGVVAAFGVKASGSGRSAGTRLSEFVAGMAAGIPTAGVESALQSPLLFRTGSSAEYGYEATLLQEVCEAILAARLGGRLSARRARVVELCEMMSSCFEEVGVIARVDEATGVASVRIRDRLARVLATLVQEELRLWVGTFPAAFYEELYRLCRLKYPPQRAAVPALLGRLTDDVVYERLGPGGKKELVRLAAEVSSEESGRASAGTLGELPPSPRLREHLASVIALMKISREYDEFESHLDTVLPRWDGPAA